MDDDWIDVPLPIDGLIFEYTEKTLKALEEQKLMEESDLNLAKDIFNLTTTSASLSDVKLTIIIDKTSEITNLDEQNETKNNVMNNVTNNATNKIINNIKKEPRRTQKGKKYKKRNK